MKSILLIIAFVCLAPVASAQYLIGGGISFGSTWAIRFSAEYNRFNYVQPFGVFKGGYDGQSLAFRLGVVKAAKCC